MAKKYKLCIVISNIDTLNNIYHNSSDLCSIYLASFLNRHDVIVTLLYAGNLSDKNTNQNCIEFNNPKYNYRIINTDNDNYDILNFNEFINSYKIFKLLERENFDIIIFDDSENCAFHSIQAKRTGSYFRYTILIFMLMNPYEYVAEKSEQWDYKPNMYIHQFVIMNFMQRYCAEYCDLLLVRSNDLQAWVLNNYWKLAQNKFILTDTDCFYQSIDKILSLFTMYNLSDNSLDIQQKPLITVILSFYNSGRYLPQALDSLAANDYPNFEVIIINASSTDFLSNKVFNEMRDKYTKWQFIPAPYESLGATRNRAAKLSNAEYFIFCDCDNVFMPYMISTLYESLVKSKLDCLASARYFFSNDEVDKIFKTKNFRLHLDYGPCLELALFANYLGDANMIVKSKIFKTLNGFIDDCQMSEDWEFHFRLLLNGYKSDSIPIPLYYYRLHSDSAMKRLINAKSEYLFYMQRKLLNLFTKYSSEEILHKLLSNIVFRMFKQLATGEFNKHINNKQGLLRIMRKKIKNDLGVPNGKKT
jgi:glycosyltransferase involved in cell wall biosynthesis